MLEGGHAGLGPDFRDQMSRTLRENALQEPDVRANGRISGMAGFPGWPDVRGSGRMSGLQIRG